MRRRLPATWPSSTRRWKNPSGQITATLTGQSRGYHYVDYQLRAAAGQTMKAVFKSPHAAAYFNLLPPGSAQTAMYVGQFGQHCMNRFDGLLPADGEM